MKRCLLVVVMLAGTAGATGTTVESAFFDFTTWPGFPLEDFAAGRLGLLEPDYRAVFLITAYRWLSGTPLDAREQASALAAFANRLQLQPPGDGIDEWLKARQEVMGKKAPAIDKWMSGADYTSFVNCNPDAFRTAARALRERRAGNLYDKERLQKWVEAQDRVFAQCGETGSVPMPSPLPSTAPAVLRADRDYQLAAARFYAQEYAAAADSFDAIARDRASPWRGWGGYLAARALIRSDRLDEARPRLEAILRAPDDHGSRRRAQRLLDFIAFRSQPEAQAQVLARRLLRPAEDFGDAAIDLGLLFHSLREDPERLAQARKAELIDWLATVHHDAEAPEPDRAEQRHHALLRFRQKHSTPWLIAALMLARPADAEPLLAAADALPADSPAWATVRYHAARLRLASPATRARAIADLDEALAHFRDRPESPVHNRLLALRFTTARDFDELVRFSVRYRLGRGWDDEGREIPDDAGTGRRQPFWGDQAGLGPARGRAFDLDGAELLSHLPLARWEVLVDHPELPPELRGPVVRAAWARALLLGDEPAAERLAARVAALPSQDGKDSLAAAFAAVAAAPAGPERRWAMLVALLKLPGVRPYVDAGFERALPLSSIEDFRDNWWCPPGPNWTGLHVAGDAPSQRWGGSEKVASLELPSFVDEKERVKALAEWHRLEAAGPGAAWLVQAVVEYVRAHPDAPGASEALFLANRATHHPACQDQRTSRASKAAWLLQHKLFPDDERTKKTPFWW